MRLDKLRASLNTRRFGKQIFFSRVIDSTNRWAKELAESGAEEGTVIVAEEQTAGRGRLGREWVSPRGGLWFSVVLRPCRDSGEAAKLVFLASLAVSEVLHQKYGLRIETKWPNDVLVDGRKICGILGVTGTSAGTSTFTVLGIGINANVKVDRYLPPSIRPMVTSIQDELGRTVRLDGLLKTMLERLEEFYDTFTAKGFKTILAQWKMYADFLGKEIVVQDHSEKISGLAYDVDVEGALVLRLENGTLKRVFTGDISLSSKSRSTLRRKL